jgi:hypothetical protein
MRKFFGYVLALAVGMFLSWPFVAQAAHTALIGGTFTAVGVSSVLKMGARGATAHIYYNGTYDQVVDLQREVGSPGSGAWEDINSFRDLAPAANTLYRLSWTTEKDNEQLRLKLRTHTSGTGVYSLFDGRTSPRVFGVTGFNRRTHINRFEDFLEEAFPIASDDVGTWEWITFINASGSVFALVDTDNEGSISGTAGTSGSLDEVAASYAVVANDAGVVSNGVMVVEYRTSMDDITQVEAFLGLSDTIAVNVAIMPFTVNSNVVSDTASTNDIGFIFSSDATDTNSWQPVSTNGGTVGNNAAEFACGFRDAVNNEYDILRLEIELNGDAFWYVNGTLCAAETIAVAPAAILVPYLGVDMNVDDATGGGVLTVEYTDFYFARPSS